MHLLTWVGFGLIGYVPNTLYMSDLKINSQTTLLFIFGINIFITAFKTLHTIYISNRCWNNSLFQDSTEATLSMLSLVLLLNPGHGTLADANIRKVRTAKRLATEINA
jgi:hypothetical protein